LLILYISVSLKYSLLESKGSQSVSIYNEFLEASDVIPLTAVAASS